MTDSGDGWDSADAVVCAFIVVVVEPGVECCGPRVVVGEGLPVGTFDGQRAVEAFDFAVLSGAVGFDEPLLGAEGGDGVLERRGVPVAPGVVGDDFSDLDAVLREEPGGATQEPCSGGTLLVGQDFGIGQT